MKQVIYLVADRHGVRRMTKTLPAIYKDEIVIKVNVEIKDGAFRPPVLEQTVVVNDWSSDIDVQDVEFRQTIITEQEAEMIRERRLERMKEILESQGYNITKAEEQ